MFFWHVSHLHACCVVTHPPFMRPCGAHSTHQPWLNLCVAPHAPAMCRTAPCAHAPQVATPSAPLVVRYVPETHDPTHRFADARELLYGTAAGTLGQLLMESEAARQGFVLANTKKLGAITAIYSGAGRGGGGAGTGRDEEEKCESSRVR